MSYADSKPNAAFPLGKVLFQLIFSMWLNKTNKEFKKVHEPN